MRRIVTGTAMWSQDGKFVSAKKLVGASQIGDFFYPGEPEWAGLQAGEYGAIAAWVEPTTVNGELDAAFLIALAKEAFNIRVADGYVTVDVGAPGEPALVTASIDPMKMGALTGAMALAQADPNAEFDWTATVDGQPADVTLVGPQLLAIGHAVAAKYQAMRTALNTLRAAIVAGEATTIADVESFVWP